MGIRVPEQGNLRGWLLFGVPFTAGMTVGNVLGVQFAPTTLLAAITSVLGSCAGMLAGIAVVNLATTASASGYRTLFE